jgi:ribonucleotide monophosphatase NagD (HAD superfamily)
MLTVLITTGVSDLNDVKNAPDEMKPKRVIGDLIELLDDRKSSK